MQWCQLISVFIDNFFEPHQSKILNIEAIVVAFNQLEWRSDKEAVLKRLLNPEHDWKRKRYLPCLLLRLSDALPREQRNKAIESVVRGFVKSGDWAYESIAAHALMTVIPQLSILQLMQILMKQFNTGEPVPARNDAYELYLRVFREYEARILVKSNEATSYLCQLPLELQDNIRDYLNPPTARPPALAGINP
jgi:hypothetical protein